MPIKLNKLGVFCGANLGNDPVYQDAATALANALCDANIALVYGGAHCGLMGVLADQVLARQGEVIGVIPELLIDAEIAHDGLTQLHVVDSMLTRKALMAELSDGFIMLPGGAGSLDEFFEMLTWSQLGFQQKPCGILNTQGYYNQLLSFLQHVEQEGFIKQVHREMIMLAEQPKSLLEQLACYEPPAEGKWIKS